MRRILITNDDGIEAGGILRLAKAAAEFGEVWVVAPDSQRSAASHGITLHGTVDVYPRPFPAEGVRAFAISGTPGDCVRLGCLSLLPEKPDAVLSGINYGYNTGTDIQYSGTAGAALEGMFQGIPSIAFSEGAGTMHETTDRYLRELLGELLFVSPPDRCIWNVNFPGVPLKECRGILRDRPVSRGTFYHDRYRIEQSFSDGGARYRVDGRYNEEAEEGTDFRAVVDGYVSVGTVKNLS